MNPAASLPTFLLASLVLAVTPGPGVIYIVTRTLAQGRAAGLASVAGVACGNIGNAAGAALGLAALFAVSDAAFQLVKWAGAAWLVTLGVRMVWQAVRDRATSPSTSSGRTRRVRRLRLSIPVLIRNHFAQAPWNGPYGRSGDGSRTCYDATLEGHKSASEPPSGKWCLFRIIVGRRPSILVAIRHPLSVRIQPPTPVRIQPPTPVRIQPPTPVRIQLACPVRIQPPTPVRIQPPTPVRIQPSSPVRIQPPSPVRPEPVEGLLEPHRSPVRADAPNPGGRLSRLQLGRDGFLVALLNPKTTLFFAAFLPQFMDPATPALGQALALSAVFVAFAACTDAVYVVAASTVVQRSLRPGAGTALRVGRITGGAVLIALGLLSALSPSPAAPRRLA